jgi:hypothetical protein
VATVREITLGGRRFGVIDFDRRTALNDDYLNKLIRATGADKVLPVDEEGDEGYLMRLQICIVDSLRAHELVAGLLLEPEQTETDFSVDQARQIAEYIAKCNAAEDREMIRELAMKAVLDFFREGLSWLQRFRASLPSANEKQGTGSTSPVPV